MKRPSRTTVRAVVYVAYAALAIFMIYGWVSDALARYDQQQNYERCLDSGGGRNCSGFILRGYDD